MSVASTRKGENYDGELSWVDPVRMTERSRGKEGMTGQPDFEVLHMRC